MTQRLSDLYVDLAVGEGLDEGRRVIHHRESRRVTTTVEPFNVERVRAEAHNALDIALDDLAEKIAWTTKIRSER